MKKPATFSDWSLIASLALLAGLLAWMLVEARHVKTGDPFFPVARVDILRADGTKASFAMQVATTLRQQTDGLMSHDRLAPNEGMLFLWQDDQMVKMWTKNTPMPLDMLFVARGGRIAKIIAEAAPRDLTLLASDAPVRAVIEIGGGEANRQNLNLGDKVLYPGLSDAP
jgi:uncharacterized membrane protein (UPF0127 family)